METIDFIIIGLIATIIVCWVIIFSFWEYSQKQKRDILHQKALVRVLRFRLDDKQDDVNSPIYFGRWILKYCKEMQDAGIIYWRYENKDFDTADLYEEFKKYNKSKN